MKINKHILCKIYGIKGFTRRKFNDRYANGFRYCSRCAVWFNCLNNINIAFYCPCCSQKLRFTPHNPSMELIRFRYE